MSEEATVFIVDDDEAVRHSLRLLMQSARLRSQVFASAREFLDAYSPQQAGCLVLDIRMPGMSGLELQEELARLGAILPVIIITGHGDVPMAVRALKSGALEFIEKPFNDQVLLDRVHRAIEEDAERRAEMERQAHITARLELLTPREREVLEMVVRGLSNKAIGFELGVTQRTVEVHRAKVMEKLQAKSLADLVRMTLSNVPSK